MSVSMNSGNQSKEINPVNELKIINVILISKILKVRGILYENCFIKTSINRKKYDLINIDSPFEYISKICMKLRKFNENIEKGYLKNILIGISENIKDSILNELYIFEFTYHQWVKYNYDLHK